MKFFRHDTDVRSNRKLRKVLRTHGPTGGFIWWAILEELYKADESGFQIHADELWLESLAESCCISDYRTLIRVLDTFAEIGLIDSQLWHEHHIYVHAIKERGDRYIEKKSLNAKRQARYKARKKEEEVSESNALLTREQTLGNAKSNEVTPSEIRDQRSEIRDQNTYLDKELDSCSHEETDGELSAPAKQKKLKTKASPNKEEYWRMIDLYNSVKPECWSGAEKLTDWRKKVLAKFWRENNKDIGLCLELISRSCAGAKLDDFWSGHDGRYTAGSLESLFRVKDNVPRYQDLANSNQVASMDCDSLHASDLSEFDLRKAKSQFQKRQQQKQDSGLQKLKALGIL